jgi:hypothetical protein
MSHGGEMGEVSRRARARTKPLRLTGDGEDKERGSITRYEDLQEEVEAIYERIFREEMVLCNDAP